MPTLIANRLTANITCTSAILYNSYKKWVCPCSECKYLVLHFSDAKQWLWQASSDILFANVHNRTDSWLNWLDIVRWPAGFIIPETSMYGYGGSYRSIIVLSTCKMEVRSGQFIAHANKMALTNHVTLNYIGKARDSLCMRFKFSF